MSNSYVRLLTKDGRLLTHAEHSQDWFKTPRPTCRAASRAVSEITQHILLRSSALYLLIKSQIPIKVGLWKHENPDQLPVDLAALGRDLLHLRTTLLSLEVRHCSLERPGLDYPSKDRQSSRLCGTAK